MRGGEGAEPLEKALLLHVFKGAGEGELAVAVGEAALQKRGLEPKRMQLIQHSAVHPPKVALVEAVRLGRPGLKVLPTLFVGAPPAERK